MSGLPPGDAEPLPALVSTAWLAQRLGRPGLRVLDASWYLPTAGRDGAGEYAAAHIPGAVYFDLDATSDQRFAAAPHAPGTGRVRAHDVRARAR